MCRRKVGVAGLALTLLGLCLTAEPAAAQVQFGGDVTWSNRYVWRGITRTSKPVQQPDIFLALQRGRAFLTAGAWTSLELRQAGANDLSDSGVGRRGFGEFNYWIEYAGARGSLDLHVGWTGYIFDNDAASGGRSSDFNTGEVYGSAELIIQPLSPKLAVWYDVDRVKGAYIETSATLQVPILPVGSIYLTGLAGWSAGQGASGTTGGESANFADDGLTHIDLSTWASFFVAEHLSVAAVFHFQFNVDDATRVTSADPRELDQETKAWIGLAVSWAHELGGGGR